MVIPHLKVAANTSQRWEKGAFLPRMPESLERLDPLLLTVAKARKVRNYSHRGEREARAHQQISE